MKEINMTKHDLAQLKSQVKKDNILLFFMVLLLFIFWYFFCDNSVFGKLVLILGPIGILASFLNRLIIYQDLISKKKYSGEFEVIGKNKEKRYYGASSESGNYDYYYVYLIKFNDWRIGDVLFEESYWNDINIGEKFEIEQAVNSSFKLKIMRGLTDFKDGIKNDYSDKKSSLHR